MSDRTRDDVPPTTPLQRLLGAGGPMAARQRSALIGELRRLQLRQLPDEDTELATVCGLCGTPVAREHRHLLFLADRSPVCVCETCWAVRSGDADFRRIGERTRWLPGFDMPPMLWARLGVPVGLAYFFFSTPRQEVVAFYPSPAGATECDLELGAWHELVEANPVLADLEPDVEALLVNQTHDPPQYAVVPIDTCYRLVGTIRTLWRGVSGGAEVREAIDQLFAELREGSRAP